MAEQSTEQMSREFHGARRAAFVQDALAAFTHRPADLLPFEEVRHRLHLRSARYLGLRNVPLDQIVGSVDRYQDFTRTFLPRRKFLQGRWTRVDRLVSGFTGLPSVELYKVGEAYFVRDGNHRVSVARQHDATTIEAHVWEYDVRVPLGANTDINDVLCKAARIEFLEQTDVDRLCSDVSIEVTQPDGYAYLLYDIETFQQIISKIDERKVPFDEAVTLWCDVHYSPIVEIVRQRDMLEGFPGRTETDLYLWLRRNQEELEVRYGHQILMEEAAEDLDRRFSEKPSPRRQVVRAVGRLAEGIGELGGRLVESIARGDRTWEGNGDESAESMLAPICQLVDEEPPCRFRGTTEGEWKEWHTEFRDRLWDLLGVGERPWQPWGPDELDALVMEDGVVHSVRRELVWLNTEEELRVPAYMFVPEDQQGPQPAIVVFPGHGTIAQTGGLQRSYQRANALELARAGFVALTMELRGFGRLGAVGHLRIDASAKLLGRTWYGLLVQDGMRALDYLLTRPEVDPMRIGATGIGAGGALSMYVAALDDRVQATLVSSYLGKYTVTCLDEEHCPCNDIPSIRRYAEMGDVGALIAPRPVLFVNGLRDPATIPAARESFAVARRGYAVLGVPNRARLLEPEGMGHAYDNQLAIAWFRRWLMPDPE